MKNDLQYTMKEENHTKLSLCLEYNCAEIMQVRGSIKNGPFNPTVT